MYKQQLLHSIQDPNHTYKNSLVQAIEWLNIIPYFCDFIIYLAWQKVHLLVIRKA